MPTLLTKEAERVKQNRVRTILAVLFLAVEKIALHKLGLMSSSKSGLLLLKTAGNRPPIRLGLSLGLSVVGRKQPPPQAAWGRQGGRERGK